MTIDLCTLVVNLRKLDDSLASVDRRRAELLQQRNAVAADLIEQVVVPLHDMWLKANPPCPTCHNMIGPDGLAYIHVGPHEIAPCPECPESPGVLPFDKWVVTRLLETWEAVWSDRANPQNGVYAYLRSIGGTR